MTQVNSLSIFPGRGITKFLEILCQGGNSKKIENSGGVCGEISEKLKISGSGKNPLIIFSPAVGCFIT